MPLRPQRLRHEVAESERREANFTYRYIELNLYVWCCTVFHVNLSIVEALHVLYLLYVPRFPFELEMYTSSHRLLIARPCVFFWCVMKMSVYLRNTSPPLGTAMFKIRL
jgi:hypothetical protein